MQQRFPDGLELKALLSHQDTLRKDFILTEKEQNCHWRTNFWVFERYILIKTNYMMAKIRLHKIYEWLRLKPILAKHTENTELKAKETF